MNLVLLVISPFLLWIALLITYGSLFVCLMIIVLIVGTIVKIFQGIFSWFNSEPYNKETIIDLVDEIIVIV